MLQSQSFSQIQRASVLAETPSLLTLDQSSLLANVKILHILDHSVPLHSGYSFRTLSLLREQRRRGWKTAQLTSPKHVRPGPIREEVDGFAFYRTPALPRAIDAVPVWRELALIRALARRIAEVAAIEKPDILHAHSPVLNVLAALRAARRLKLPVVYE